MQGSFTEKMQRTKPQGFTQQRDPKRDRKRKPDFNRQRAQKRQEY